MRRIFANLLIIAGMAVTFIACQKEITAPEDIDNNQTEITDESFSVNLTLNAAVEETKTYLDENLNVLWGKGESVTLYLQDGDDNHKFTSSTPSDDFSDKPTATFSFSFDSVVEASMYSFGGIYPASASKGIENKNAAAYKVALPAMQNAMADNYDPAAFIMVLRPDSFNEIPTEYTAYFRRAVALNKITLNNVKENINSVEISVPNNKYLAGRRYFDLTSGESGEVYENGGRTNTIKVISNYASSTINVWFTSWGVDLVEGEELTIKMTSDTKEYTRTITVNEKGIKFIEGSLNTLAVNMATAEEKTLDNIAGKYLIASKTSAGWFLMTPTNGGKFFTATSSVSTENDVDCSSFYDVVDVDQYVWEVAKYDNAYSIKSTSTEKYVSYSGSSNEAYVANSLGEAAKMSIDLKGHSATIESMNSSGRKLQYNASSPRFAFYATDQTAIYMIPWTPDTTPRISVSETSKDLAYKGGEVTFNYTLKNLDGQTLNVTVSDPQMLSASAENNVLTVNVSENEGDARTGTITLSCGEAEDVVLTVNQAEYVAAGGVKSWKLVTDASTLKSGDVIRFGCSSKNTAAGSMGSQKYFSSVTASYSSGVMNSDGAIDITLGGSSDQWTFTTSEGTISTSAAKALKKDGSGVKTWKITISDSGDATIQSTTTNYGWIQYNASSPRFLNYASNQTAIQIYRYE